jgi:predicted GIY-YIG superfamily endonuclease
MAFWVYILHCADGSYYTGHTDNLEMRIQQHHAGAISSCYTVNRRPLKLVFSQDFPTREEALASEQQLKGWSRKKKEAMMRGDWAEVSRLAKSKTAHQETVRPEPVEGQSAVRPEPVEGRKPAIPVRPEPVEGRAPSVHPSTSSGRTDGAGLLTALGKIQGRKPATPVRPELVEGRKPAIPVRPEPVEGRKPAIPVRPELVEGRKPATPVRPEIVEGRKPAIPVRPEPVEGRKPALPVRPAPL